VLGQCLKGEGRMVRIFDGGGRGTVGLLVAEVEFDFLRRSLHRYTKSLLLVINSHSQVRT
jgi:hypothetical protein